MSPDWRRAGLAALALCLAGGSGVFLTACGGAEDGVEPGGESTGTAAGEVPPVKAAFV